MTRLRCHDCLDADGRHCRHTGHVAQGMILVACRCLDCDPQPIQARLFSHALVESDLGGHADCGQPGGSLPCPPPPSVDAPHGLWGMLGATVCRP